MVTKIFAKDAHGCVVMSDATNIETRKENIYGIYIFFVKTVH